LEVRSRAVAWAHFGKHIPIAIPPELADEAALLAYLKLGPKELKKIWWYRHLMYRQFSIAKGSGKSRLITAPDRRLKILQSKLMLLLDQLYRIRNPVHGQETPLLLGGLHSSHRQGAKPMATSSLDRSAGEEEAINRLDQRPLLFSRKRAWTDDC
jgi:hypothetical protein